jgi:ABC-type spermidine/putrescine transport system permease subunit II
MTAAFASSARTAHFARSASRAERIARIDRLATLLDTRFAIPFTRFRFGADSLIGLAPGVGDAITTALALYIVYEAHKLGAPKTLLARMLGNVAIDGAFGIVPVAGDVFDVMFRANRRNVRILREHLDRAGR